MRFNQIRTENIKRLCSIWPYKYRTQCTTCIGGGVVLTAAAFEANCGFIIFPLHYFCNFFGWIFLWSLRENKHFSLVPFAWWMPVKTWLEVETAVLWGALRYWFRLMWLTTVSSCAKWPHQRVPGWQFWLKLRKQRAVSDFQYGQNCFTNRFFFFFFLVNCFCSHNLVWMC